MWGNGACLLLKEVVRAILLSSNRPTCWHATTGIRVRGLGWCFMSTHQRTVPVKVLYDHHRRNKIQPIKNQSTCLGQAGR
jgi:hypothetical protein